MRRAAILLALSIACAPITTPSEAPSPGRLGADQVADVFAAASLTDAFREIASTFETERGGTVRFNFASSATLASQIEQGASAHLFASADEQNALRVQARAGVPDAPIVPFASNRLAIVVARGNPKRIATLADLARPDVVTALAAPSVPAGSYAREALHKAGVTVVPASQEIDVRAVLAKVTLGEADAGIVYATDVRAGGTRVERVEIVDAHNVAPRYFLVYLLTPDFAAAGPLANFLLGRQGRAILERHGFGPP